MQFFLHDRPITTPKNFYVQQPADFSKTSTNLWVNWCNIEILKDQSLDSVTILLIFLSLKPA